MNAVTSTSSWYTNYHSYLQVGKLPKLVKWFYHVDVRLSSILKVSGPRSFEVGHVRMFLDRSVSQRPSVVGQMNFFGSELLALQSDVLCRVVSANEQDSLVFHIPVPGEAFKWQFNGNVVIRILIYENSSVSLSNSFWKNTWASWKKEKGAQWSRGDSGCIRLGYARLGWFR